MIATKHLVANVGKSLKSNAPEILTGLGLTGVVTTSYLAGKASFDMAKDEDADPHASTKDKIKRYWKLYIPAGISGTLTLGCIIGASKANSKRTAAAMTAYSLTEKAFVEYKEKVVEQIGKGKEKKLQEAIIQDRVNANPPGKEVVIVGGGHVLCLELHTGRYFRSTMEALKRAENAINHKVIHEMYVTLDELYVLLGLDSTTDSDKFGWTSDRLVEFIFTYVGSPDGEPCLAFEYNYTKTVN